jgi:hypothetical protein
VHLKRDNDIMVLVDIVLSEKQIQADERLALRKKDELERYEQMKDAFYYELVDHLKKIRYMERNYLFS